jgi:hypothetical protein
MPVGWCVTCVGLNENSQNWMKTMKITGKNGETWRGPTFRWHLPTMLSYLRSWKTIIPCEKPVETMDNHPRCSMYGIFTIIYLHLGHFWDKCR